MKKRVLALLLAVMLLFTACNCTAGTKTTYTLYTLQFEVDNDFVVEETLEEGLVLVYLDETRESYLHITSTAASGFAMGTAQAKVLMQLIIQTEGIVNTESETTEFTVGGVNAWTMSASITKNGTEQADYTIWMFVESDTMYVILYVTPPASTAKYLPEAEAVVSSMRFVEALIPYSSFGMHFEAGLKWEAVQEASFFAFVLREDPGVMLFLYIPNNIEVGALNKQRAETDIMSLVDALGGQNSSFTVSDATVGEDAGYVARVNTEINGAETRITYWTWQREAYVYRCIYIAYSDMYDAYVEEAQAILDSVTYDESVPVAGTYTVNEDGVFESNGVRLTVGDFNFKPGDGYYTFYLPSNLGYVDFSSYPLGGEILDAELAAYMASSMIGPNVDNKEIGTAQKTTINGYEVWVLQSTATRGGETRKSTFWFFEQGGTMHMFVYITLSEDYETYLPEAQSLINTVEFTG